MAKRPALPPIILDETVPNDEIHIRNGGKAHVFKVPPSLTQPAPAKPAKERVLYLVKINLADTGYSGVSLLSHEKQFDEAQLKGMVAEATQVITETRIPKTREELVGREIEKSGAAKFNENLFHADVDVFEAVMVDKFAFRVEHANVQHTTFIKNLNL
jgi:hypothetical protein